MIEYRRKATQGATSHVSIQAKYILIQQESNVLALSQNPLHDEGGIRVLDTKLGREREGKREHLASLRPETLPFTSSLRIRGGKSRERRYTRGEKRIFETIFLQKLFPFVKTCETYPFQTSHCWPSKRVFIVEAFELCLFAFMHSSY